MHKKKDTKNYFFLLTEQNRNAKGNKLDMTEHNYTVLSSESIRNKRSPLSPHHPPSSCPDGVTVQFYIKVEIVHIWKGGGEIINDHSSTSARIREREGGGETREGWCFTKLEGLEETTGKNSTIQKIIYDFSLFVLEKNMIYNPPVITREMKSLKI